jgi:hypothetical protein
MGTLNLLLIARSPLPHTQLNPRLQALLFFWHQAASLSTEAFLPTEHRGSALPIVPDSKRALTPLSKSKKARFSFEGRKAMTCYSAGSTRSPVSPRYTEPSTSHCTSLQESDIFLLSKNWNPRSSTEWQSTLKK